MVGEEAAGNAILASGEVGAGSLADELRGSTFLSTSVTGYELVADSTIAATFTAEGTISLNAGCNTLFGPVDIADGHLSSSMLASTMMACDEALMQQDTWLSGLVEGGVDAVLAGGILTLTAGEVVIELAQQDTLVGTDGAEVGDLEEPTPGDGEIPAHSGD